ncbi:MAG: zinc ribbon domain-containing protein [Clostridia bacterium]|nr:zinc ribbon domain-containing protein [Clostridia bacterium]
MSKFCQTCGKELDDKAEFCDGCGQAQSTNATQQTPPVGQTTQPPVAGAYSADDLNDPENHTTGDTDDQKKESLIGMVPAKW